MESSVPALIEKGLTEDEAKLLSKYLEEGKPGLAKSRAERMAEIYCLGYSCQEINRWFPEYPLEILLYARVHYGWDQIREKYLSSVQQEVLNSSLAVRMDTMKFLQELLTATHVKWRKELLDYIADPETKKAPDFIPKNLYGYGQIIETLNKVVRVAGPESKGGGLGESPLVSINVGQNQEGKPDIVISNPTQEDVRAALLAEAKAKKRDK